MLGLKWSGRDVSQFHKNHIGILLADMGTDVNIFVANAIRHGKQGEKTLN